MRVRATRDQIEDIKSSLFWRDVKRELRTWRRGFRAEGETLVEDTTENNSTTASVLLHMGDLSGRAKAIDYLLSLPDIFLSVLEDQKDNKIDK